MGFGGSSMVSSSPRKSTSLQHLFLLEHSEKDDKQSPPDPRLEEILSSISASAMDPFESFLERECKTAKLQELSILVASSKTCITSNQVLSSLMKIITVNVFRPLPPPSNPPLICEGLYDEFLDSFPSPLWPSLHLLYGILLDLLITLDSKPLSAHIDRAFIINLLSLFRSEDSRERERVKHVFHQIYLSFESQRGFMRKRMNNFLLQHCLGLEDYKGVGELLEIWSSIIEGWEAPLKEEEKTVLTRVLIPLHKSKWVHFYYRQLCLCVRQLVRKEQGLGAVVVRAILRYWPMTNCVKEVIFISEIEELVDIMEPDLLRDDDAHHLALKLFTQISKCSNSSNSQVAERALYLWNKERMVGIAFGGSAPEVVGVVVEALEWNLAWHWSKSVKHLTRIVKQMLQEADPCLYQKSTGEIGRRQSTCRRDEMLRRERWERLESQASGNTSAS